MLAATFFSLLAPGIESSLADGAARGVAAALVAAGVLGEAGVLALVHRWVPHEHFAAGREGPEALHVRRIWLFVLAIALHNVPEGMAVGVGFGAGDVTSGIPLAIGIGLQNVPEGLAVAAGVTSIGYAPTRAFLLSLGTGVLEAFGALFGAAGAAVSGGLLPLALAFAAGAMLFVIAREIIPETALEETKVATTFSLLAGFLLMMTLDTAIGQALRRIHRDADTGSMRFVDFTIAGAAFRSRGEPRPVRDGSCRAAPPARDLQARPAWLRCWKPPFHQAGETRWEFSG